MIQETIKYDGYTEEEIKSLSQNNQDLGRIQERMEQIKYELFMISMMKIWNEWCFDKNLKGGK